MNKELINKVDLKIKDQINKIDELEEYYSEKIIKAFKNNNLCESDFNGTTGYGYNDYGRDKIENIYSEVLGSEASLVRSQFISGSHALTVTFFGLLRPNDLLLSICGKPYDTMDEVIGIRENKSSLKAFGIKYDQIDLLKIKKSKKITYNGLLGTKSDGNNIFSPVSGNIVNIKEMEFASGKKNTLVIENDFMDRREKLNPARDMSKVKKSDIIASLEKYGLRKKIDSKTKKIII